MNIFYAYFGGEWLIREKKMNTKYAQSIQVAPQIFFDHWFLIGNKVILSRTCRIFACRTKIIYIFICNMFI